ncbi:unnamed protein product [Menidia menidia]|uniref:(Atlantic silverside) hypothetical protein n=1 Tax=Menidia menidia TaxID=238744 RepID=A0A8S4AIN1_9TELE|nr:unnamed protein product [Menidia menidia]
MSVDSSVSAPLSLDSLGPAAQARVRAAPPDTRSALSSTRRQPEPSDRSQDGHSDPPLPSSRAAEDSLVSSTTLSEIRKVLSHADNLVSTGSSAGPSCHSDEDLFLSLPTKASTSADPRSYTSLRWARSQPDPAQSPLGREASDHSPSQPTPAPPTATVPSQSARRTEPEGCSAAPPDKVPAQPPPSAPPTPADGGGAPEEGERPTTRVPAQSGPSSPIPEEADPEDADPGAVSDGSSESSLAVRVARLLQSGSPSTMVSSTDQEESKAREWIKLKISGQQCEPLELDIEDRRRIEEIKKELLLRNPMKPSASGQCRSHIQGNRVDREQEPARSSRTGSLLSDASSRRGGAAGPPDSDRQLRKTLHSDLEAAVCEIAAREGVLLPARRPPAPPASISPSPSSAPSSSPALEPLHLTELSTGRPLVADAPPTSYLDGGCGTGLTAPAATEPPPVCGQSGSFHPGDQSGASQSVSGRQMREDTAGGGREAPPPLVQSTDEEDENVKTTGSFKHLENFPVQSTPARAFAPSSVGTGHASRARLPQSLQTARHTSSPAVSLPPRGAAALPGDSSSAASSPDEGVGSCSPAEWCDTRERAGRGAFKAVRATQPVAPPHKTEAPPPSLYTAAPAPVLLPYKPRGSEELFYVPQRKADISSTVPSDTTMESSHTGSDDAVPPRFSSEVLGHQDPGLDRGVTFRHTDGIYSKRLRTSTLRMQGAGRQERPPPSSQKVSTIDQGTSPIRPLQREQTQPDAERYQPLREAERGQTPVPRTRGEPDREAASGSLDGLWQKFCGQWEEEESRPSDASLLERLERLSRLLHGTKAPQAGGGGGRRRRTEAGENSPLEGGGSEDLTASSGSMSTVDTARLVRAFGAHKVQPLTSGSSLSKLYSTISKQREDREGRRGRNKDPPRAATPSESSATDHWVAYFSSFLKSGGLIRACPQVAPESASSSSTHTLLSDRGPSRLLAAKKAVRLDLIIIFLEGELEIVCNGTRRHTRDVGTTFPSPGGSGRSGPASSSSSSTPRGETGRRSPSKSLGVQKQRKNKRSPSKPFPEGRVKGN